MAINSQKKTQGPLAALVAAAIVLTAIFGIVLTPGVAQAQTTCNTTTLMALAAQANAAGYYGVTLDLGVCQVQIIFKNPGASPLTFVSPLAPTAPVTVTTTVVTTGTVLSNVAATYQPLLDYAKDAHERVPNNGQQTWVAQVIQRAMVSSYDPKVDAVAMLNQAILAIQVMAEQVNAPRGSGDIVLKPGMPGIVAMLWYANIADAEVQQLVNNGYHLVYRLESAAVLLSPPDVVSLETNANWWVGVE